MQRKEVKKFPVKLIVSLLVLIFVIASAGEFYHRVEGWDRIDAVYFSVVSFTTIGYGDFVPTTDLGKIVTIFLSFLGIAAVFHFVFLIGDYMFEKKVSEEKRDIKRDIRESEEEEEEEMKKRARKRSSRKKK